MWRAGISEPPATPTPHSPLGHRPDLEGPGHLTAEQAKMFARIWRQASARGYVACSEEWDVRTVDRRFGGTIG